MAVFESSLANETFVGNKGEHNTFIFREGCGHDTIKSYTGEGDTICFDGFKDSSELWNSIHFLKKGNNLLINYGNDNSVTIINYFKNPDASPIQNLQFTNLQDEPDADYNMILKDEIVVEFYGKENKKNTITGTILDDDIFGGEKDDVLKGNAGEDYFWGGKGNDKIYGGADVNVIYVDKGDGNDVLYSDKNGEDTIVFQNADIDNLYLEKGKYNGIKIVTENGDSVELANYLKTGTTSVDRILTESESEEEKEITLEDLFNSRIINVYGNDKKNKLTGTYLDDQIFGYEGNDTLSGNKGDDDLYGGDGNDTLKGEDGSDVLYGGKGDDKIYGGAGDNYIHLEKDDGNDVVYSDQNGNDTITIHDASLDTLHLEKGKYNGIKIVTENGDSVELANYLKTGTTSVEKIIAESNLGIEQSINLDDFLLGKAIHVNGDYKKNKLTGTNLDDEMYGYDGNDTLSGNKGDDYLYGHNGNDTIKGGDGNDEIYGDEGNDKLYGNNGSDLIFGGNGNDTIYCGGDRDIVYSEMGNDTIYGESGYNVHYFKEGNGQDKLYMSKGADILVFDKSLKDTLTYEKDGNNLIIKYGNSGDTLTIMKYFSSKTKSVDTIVFADYDAQTINIVNAPGTTQMSLSNNIIQNGHYEYWEFSYDINQNDTAILNCQILNGNNNNNLIYSSKKYDIISAGQGDDTVYLQSKLTSVDDISGDDKYVVSSLKNGTILDDRGGYDEIIINDSYKNINFIFDVARNDNYPTFDNGRLYVFNNSTIKNLVKTKNLSIKAGIQINNYFNDGTIEQIGTKDCYVTNTEIEKVKTNIKTWLQRNGYNTALQALMYGSSTAQKELLEIYKNIEWIKYTLNGTNKNNTIIGTDYGETINGKNGNDTIYAKGGDDYVDGGKGDDTIYLGSGVDIINCGEGNNTIIANENNSKAIIMNGTGNDTIQFNTYQNIIYAKNNNCGDLYLKYGENTIQLNEYFDKDTFSVKTINNNGDINNLPDAINNELYIYGTTSDDVFVGSNGNDVFVTESGNDTILSSSGTDKIHFETQEELTYIKDLSNNDLKIIHGNNSIKLVDYFTSNTPHSVLKINNGGDNFTIESVLQENLSYIGTQNEDTITGKAKYNVIKGESGNDTLNSLGDSCTYIFEEGDGVDTIISSNGENVIKFPTQKELSYYRVHGNNDLTIKYSENDKIILKNYFDNNEFSVNKILNGENELNIQDEIYNCLNIIYDETTKDIYNTTGNQIYDLSIGGNTIYFGIGSGNDTVNNTSSTDKLVINNDGSSLKFVHNLGNNDLQISYTENDTLSIKNYFNNTTNRIDSIILNDEEISISGEISKGLNIIDSGVGNSDIYGTSGNDTITISSSNNNIYGDKGDDTYSGDTSNNTYYIHSEDGNDLIEKIYTETTLVFDAEMSNLKFSIPDSRTLVITGYGSENDSLTCGAVIGYSGDGANIITSIITNDMQIERLYIHKHINGNEGTGDFYGSSKNDALIGSSNNETIYGGDGNDYIYGGQGNDTIYGGSGNDIIHCNGGGSYNGNEGYNTYIVDADLNEQININSCDYATPAGSISDTVIINNKTKNDLSIFVHITQNGEYGNSQHESWTIPGLHITNIDDFGNDYAGIKILNFFRGVGINGSNYNISNVEKIITDGGYYINRSSIENITAQITDWLKLNNFESTSLAIENGTAKQKDELKAIFDYAWQVDYENIEGTEGDDTYVVSLAHNSYDEVLDCGGNDTIIINNIKDNIAMYYNVLKSGHSLSTLYIKDRNYLTEEQGVEHNLFDTDKYIIETTIINNNTENTNDDYVWIYDAEQIDAITSEVVAWLNTNDYYSVEDVINSDNPTDINAVLAIFDQVWQPL